MISASLSVPLKSKSLFKDSAIVADSLDEVMGYCLGRVRYEKGEQFS